MPVVSWLRRWGPRLGGVVGVQAGVQLLNALSGILAVWLLPRETAYAWFTVASSMMIMTTLLADSGMTTAVQALGGPRWQDRVQFSQLIRAVQRHQRWLAAATVLFVLPWMLVLLHRLHAPVWSMVVASLLVACFTWPAASAQVLANVNRLHSRVRSQLLAELLGAGMRLALTACCLGLVYAFGFRSMSPDYPAGVAFVLVVAAPCLAAVLYQQLVRREASQVLDSRVADTPEFDARIREVISGTALFTIYYGLQGQVSTWLMSLYGASAQVADVGALSRLSLLFAVAGAPVVQLAGPAFARCQDRVRLLRQLLVTAGLYGLFTAGVLVFVTLLPGPVLWLLGPQYAHLGAELQLAALVPAAAGLSGIVWGLVLARGWIRSSAWVVPIGLSAQIAGCFLFDFTRVSGVLGFNLFIMVPVLLLACLVVWRGLGNWRAQTATAA